MAEKTIDAYIAKHPDWRGDVLRALHALVLETAPGATAGIKWAQPVYEWNGPLIFVKAASRHVTFGFWRGAELADPDGLLDGDGERMRHIKLKSLDLPRSQLQAWVREAIWLNTEKGDPTRRA
jgi:hypothetical protein